MKKITAWMLTAALALSLAACGKSGSDSKGNDGSSTEDTGFHSTSDTTYDAGNFTVYVPAGREAIPQDSSDEIMIAEGATYYEASGEWFYENKTVSVTYFTGEKAGETADMKKNWESWGVPLYEIEDVHIGHFTWHGFVADITGADVACLWTVNDDNGYQVSASLSYDYRMENSAFRLDKDIQSIIESLA